MFESELHQFPEHVIPANESGAGELPANHEHLSCSGKVQLQWFAEFLEDKEGVAFSKIGVDVVERHRDCWQRFRAGDCGVDELNRDVLGVIKTIGRSHDQTATTGKDPSEIKRCCRKVGGHGA